MKILFITGSLAATHDGVADYTLRLADALRERGVETRCLAWSDSSIAGTQTTATHLRLPARLPLRAKLAAARHFLSGFHPDVASLQFVPYAFDPRGLPGKLAQELRTLLPQTPFHVFIHELWVLPSMRSSLKNRLIGSCLQKPLVVKNLRALAPRRIHTSTPLYRDLLIKENFSLGDLLPIPGNIAYVTPPTSLPATADRPTRHLGFFGNIFSSAPLEHFFEYLCELKDATGLTLTISSAGDLPAPARQRWQRLASRFRGRLDVERLGHLTSREAAYYLQSLDILISAYSPTFWTKSGTVAAAREFAKPVVLISPRELPANPQHPPLPPGIFTDLNATLLTHPPRLERLPILPQLAEKFLYEISALA